VDRRSSGAPVTPVEVVCVFGLLRRGLRGNATANDEQAKRVKELLAAPAPAGALESEQFGRFLDPLFCPARPPSKHSLVGGSGALAASAQTPYAGALPGNRVSGEGWLAALENRETDTFAQSIGGGSS